jgi:hypothetical protein
LAGTHLANLEPNRQPDSENSDNSDQDEEGTELTKHKPKGKKVAVKTISGISKFFWWEWPVDGPLAGYICARALPHIGSYEEFSPAKIAKLCKEAIKQPKPTVSGYSEPSSQWNMPIPNLPGRRK